MAKRVEREESPFIPDDMARRIETWWPLLGSCIAGIALLPFGEAISNSFVKLVENVLPTAVTIAAVLAGFQATSQSVLLAIRGSRVWRRMARHKNDRRLVNFHTEACISLLVFIAASLAVLAIHTTGIVAEWLRVVVAIFLVTNLIHAAFCSYRIVALMGIILKADDRPSVSSDDDEDDLEPRPGYQPPR